MVKDKNIFDFKNTTHEYKFINWARKFREEKNQVNNKFRLISYIKCVSIIKFSEKNIKKSSFIIY